jgi:hypothetical protein
MDMQTSNLPPAIVLDTSFLIDKEKDRLWTAAPYHQLKDPNTQIEIPAGVKKEFDYGLQNGKSQYQSGSHVHQVITDLLGGKEFLVYTNSLQGTLADRLNQVVTYRGVKHSALTVVDKTVVQATLDLAREERKVAVASGDRGIIAQISNIEREENLDITTYSPFGRPVQHDNIECLVSDKVIAELRANIESKEKFPAYLAISNNMHIGAQAFYSIAFGVYVNRTNSLRMPDIDNGNFVRIFYLPNEENTTIKSKLQIGIRMMSSDMFGIYTNDVPYILLRKTKNKLKPHESLRVMNVYGTGKKLPKQYKQRLQSVEIENLSWLRIGEEEIKNDKLTEGKLDQMRRVIAAHR